ncbi:MAG TPA: carboxypeptidase-like regulatory domain-containing protein, partial [Bryobacteraceae bacterium]|nr:carboxypeptidase-like regulatory domain-containing protein [Bryobacteraceae bacterium]
MRFLRAITGTFVVCFCAALLWSQSTDTTISGNITDPTGAVIPNAHVHVTEGSTGRQFDVSANAEGRYTVPGIAVGIYTIEASAAGFKSKIIQNAKVDVGTPLTVNIQLEIGAASERVEVQAEATQVETATATVGTTVTGRQITELPFTSRDALDLALLTPGNSANGAPRQSSFNGLPHDALNITMDGVDTQDNLLKSSNGGGMYTYIRPRVDAIDEFNISSAVEGAESASEGAVQIKFVTKRGTNDFHGGLYEYFRNTALNANYYFNNEAGQPRQLLKLNQFGGKVGGPILKNKLFFFINAEGFTLPESNSRQRLTLTPTAAAGNFTYTDKGGQTHTVNVLSAAANAGYSSTINPEVGNLLGLINANIPTVGITPASANTQLQTFNTSDEQKRDFVTARFDYNITEKLHWEFVYSYDYFYAFPDSLNSNDAPYPNIVTYNGYNTEGGQISNRFFGSTALQWTISPTMTNEIRAGLQGGTSVFETEINPQALPGGLRLNFPAINGSTALYSPVNRQPSQWRNTPVKQISDTLNWVKGNHTLSMGGNGTLVSFYGNTVSGLTPVL